MATTLITTVQGIGLGVMGQSLAEHCPEITHIQGVRRNPEQHIDLKFPERCILTIHDNMIPLGLFEKSQCKYGDKIVYIETSYSTSRMLRNAGYRTIWIPMWEQGSVPIEILNTDTCVSVTQKTLSEVQKVQFAHSDDGRHPPLHILHKYLPWPVDTVDVVPKRVERVRTILHNAGSLGGNLRKGTQQAIQIFQRSGLARRGVRLVIHTWVPVPPEIECVLSTAPEGIEWTNKFLPRTEDIYDAYDPDLLLMPSKIEGHALVALEAMARGIPALVTDYAPINEYEQNDLFKLPISHYVASPLRAPYAIVDINEGANQLRRLCALDLTEKSIEVADFVEKQMSWQTLGQQWRDLLS